MFPSHIKLSFWLDIEGKVDEVIILLDGFWSHQQFGDSKGKGVGKNEALSKNQKTH